MLKKLSFGGYLNVIAAILGVAGAVLTIVSSVFNADNKLSNLPMLAAACIVGAVLCLVPIVTSARLGNFDPVGTVSIWAAIAAYCYAVGGAVGQRVMMIAGLFSFNSGNTIGWQVFYISAGAWGCLVVGCVALIISSFLRSVKQEG